MPVSVSKLFQTEKKQMEQELLAIPSTHMVVGLIPPYISVL